MQTQAPRATPYGLTLGAAAVAALLTLAVAVLPFLRFAYEAPQLHTVLETLNAVVALLVAYLFFGRFRSQRRARDLLVGVALVVLATANLPLTAVPTALSAGGTAAAWAGTGVRVMGTLLVAAAAFTPASQLLRTRTALRLCATVAVAAATLVVAAVLLGDRLPPPLAPGTRLDDAGPSVTGHPALLAAQTIGLLAYAAASVSFTRQAARAPDQLVRFLGAGCAVAAFSRVNYLLFPSLYTDFVYTGDLLRLAFYVLLLVGATREISSYWAAQSQAAVLEDRRRLARDLHDGLTQELTYLWSQSRQLARRPGDEQLVERINGAAGRAIDESRRAIAALTRPLDEPFAVVLRQQVEQMAARYDVEATAQLDDTAAVDAQQAEQLLRVTAEAFRNAVRHGRASHVQVVLAADPLRLVVRDDGQGFDPDVAKTATGFGLVSMRERAEGLGAAFSLESTPAGGTSVCVEWT